jgi:hypothetical protein
MVHRNCLVFPKYVVKISDSGSVKATYHADYYTTMDGSRLPIRWMAWESLILVGIFSTLIIKIAKFLPFFLFSSTSRVLCPYSCFSFFLLLSLYTTFIKKSYNKP